MDARKAREIEFHNYRFATGTRGKQEPSQKEDVEKFYSVAERSRKCYVDLIKRDCQARRVLEYGCGTGSHALFLTRLGAKVTGIDISDVAVQKARENAEANSAEGVRFEVMDAESLDFQDATFDLICGTAILHHLELEKAFSELARTVKPTGKCVFLEPLGHNLLINIYRKRTPELRTPDEHPLLMKDFKLARKYFGKVKLHCFHLCSLFAVPFRSMRVFGGLLRCLDGVDAALFRTIPFMKRYAWATVVVLSEPMKGPTTCKPHRPGA